MTFSGGAIFGVTIGAVLLVIIVWFTTAVLRHVRSYFTHYYSNSSYMFYPRRHRHRHIYRSRSWSSNSTDSSSSWRRWYRSPRRRSARWRMRQDMDERANAWGYRQYRNAWNEWRGGWPAQRGWNKWGQRTPLNFQRAEQLPMWGRQWPAQRNYPAGMGTGLGLGFGPRAASPELGERPSMPRRASRRRSQRESPRSGHRTLGCGSRFPTVPYPRENSPELGYGYEENPDHLEQYARERFEPGEVNVDDLEQYARERFEPGEMNVDDLEQYARERFEPGEVNIDDLEQYARERFEPGEARNMEQDARERFEPGEARNMERFARERFSTPSVGA